MVYRNIWKDMKPEIWKVYKECPCNGDNKTNIILGILGDIYCFRDIMADHRRVFEGDGWTAQCRKNKSVIKNFDKGDEDLKEVYVSCYEGLIDGEDLYIVDIQYSLLIKYNIIDFSYEILTDFIYWSSGLPFRVIKIFKVDKSLYFITSNRYCVFEYNILSHKVSVYEESENLGDKWVIKDGFMYKNKIYIFPLRIDESIQIFDIVTKTFCKFKSIEESLNVNDIVIPLKSNVSEGVKINSDIYVAVCGTSYICQISLIHKEIDVWNVGKGVHISGITLDKNKYWLISDEDSVKESRGQPRIDALK